MSEEKKPENQATEEKFGRDEVQQLINAAMASATRQFSTKLEKSMADLVAKMGEKKPEPEPQEDKGGKVDSKAKALEQQVAEIKRQLDEERSARRQVEESARQEKTQSQLRSLLEGANVRKELLDVAVGHLAKVSGALRYGDDGAALMAVKRARMKGATAEEMLFDDLKAGVDDWVKTDEAKPFLSPPSTARPQSQNGSGVRTFATPTNDENRVDRIIDLMKQPT